MSDLSTSAVSGLSNISSALSSTSQTSDSDSGDSFADVLSKALSLTEDTNSDSNASTLDLLTGNTDDLASTMISTEKAEVALNLTVAVRNKAVDAYKEIMSMQV